MASALQNLSPMGGRWRLSAKFGRILFVWSLVATMAWAPVARADEWSCPGALGRLAKKTAIESAKIAFFPFYAPGKGFMHLTGEPERPYRLLNLLADAGRLLGYLGVSYYVLPSLDPNQGGFSLPATKDDDGTPLLYVDIINENHGAGGDFKIYARWGAERERLVGVERLEIEGKNTRQVLELLKDLRKKGRIKRLRFIGHSSSEGTNVGVGLTTGGINNSTFRDYRAEVNALPKDLFAKDAEIDLLGCYVGTNKDLPSQVHWHLLNQHGKGGRVAAYVPAGPLGEKKETPRWGQSLQYHLGLQYVWTGQLLANEALGNRVVVDRSKPEDANRGR